MLRPFSPYYSVQAFFMISGFYMGLLHNKYADAEPWIFYSNRYSRLAASYWIVLVVTLFMGLAGWAGASHFVTYQPGGLAERLFLFATNSTLVGMDITELISTTWSQGLLIPQGWSLGMELWFYMLVPLFWRCSTKTLVTVIGASLLCRIAIIESSLPFYPWQQRFFPAELMFFLLGMLSFRLSDRIGALPLGRHSPSWEP